MIPMTPVIFACPSHSGCVSHVNFVPTRLFSPDGDAATLPCIFILRYTCRGAVPCLYMLYRSWWFESHPDVAVVAPPFFFLWEPMVRRGERPFAPEGLKNVHMDNPAIVSHTSVTQFGLTTGEYHHQEAHSPLVTLHLDPDTSLLLAQRVGNGNHQRRSHRPCGRRHRSQAVAGSRAASAGSESREGEVRLLEERQQGAISSGQRPRRVLADRGERNDGSVAGAGAGGRADVDGGDRAEPGPEQQPSGVDLAGRVRPHLVPLHRLHLHA